MPDSFDASHAPGFFHVVPPRRRDLKGGAVIRVAEVVIAPLILLVGGTVALAAMVLWGVWVVVCRWIRPLLYTIAGIALVAMVLLVGGVMGTPTMPTRRPAAGWWQARDCPRCPSERPTLRRRPRWPRRGRCPRRGKCLHGSPAPPRKSTRSA